MESSQRNSELSFQTSAIEKLPVELVTKIFRICQTDVVDDEDLGYSSILHPKHAPLLLCQISSGWRKLAENTPRLWDTIPLFTSDLGSEDKFMRTFLGRSRELPLCIIVTAPRETSKVGDEQFLVRLWEFHDRFERLVFRIPASDFHVTSLPSPTILPLLRSLDLSIFGNSTTRAILPALLSLFHDVPSLRDLDLDFSLTPALASQIFTPNFFPWHQLTKVVSLMHVSTTTVRNILRLCTGLQICILANIETLDVSDQSPLCILGHLCTLELTGDGDRPFTGFFESLAFPSLNRLVLDCFAIPGRSLLELHNRSQFQLKKLEISWPRLTVAEIIQFLQLLPTLESLILTQCDGSGNVFKAFTYRGDTAAPVLTLPHLMKLGLGENYEALRLESNIDQAIPGKAVAEMVESFVQYASQLNPWFPCLKSIGLVLEGQKFPGDIEHRLAAACASTSGLVVDHCVDERE